MSASSTERIYRKFRQYTHSIGCAPVTAFSVRDSAQGSLRLDFIACRLCFPLKMLRVREASLHQAELLRRAAEDVVRSRGHCFFTLHSSRSLFIAYPKGAHRVKTSPISVLRARLGTLDAACSRIVRHLAHYKSVPVEAFPLFLSEAIWLFNRRNAPKDDLIRELVEAALAHSLRPHIARVVNREAT